MNVGWMGLGKLGLPCALALAGAGHKVTGCDPSPRPWAVLAGQEPPPREDGIGELLGRDLIGRAGTPAELAAASDIVFVAVQTPHAPQFGGETLLPGDRADFEYAFLVQACRDLCAAVAPGRDRPLTVAVVSTVLPGTVSRLIRPLLHPGVRLAYTPLFIAMGTTIPDFRDPEFVICGVDNPRDAVDVRSAFGPLHAVGPAPGDRLFVTGIETAEAIKVLYNTAISAKVVLGNTIMEVCHKTGADCDQVVDALAKATDRVISPAYLRGGMGDGGACHPRDLAAMSWLARRLDLSYDLYGQLAEAREAQTGWLAQLIAGYADLTGLPVVILGKSYKPGSDLTAGSPALLLAGMLGERVALHWDKHTDTGPLWLEESYPAVFAVATRHPEFPAMQFPPGSVVVDPFGYIPDQPGVTVVRVGRKT